MARCVTSARLPNSVYPQLSTRGPHRNMITEFGLQARLETCFNAQCAEDRAEVQDNNSPIEVNDLTDLITNAIAQHRAGNFAEARKRYKSILRATPKSCRAASARNPGGSRRKPQNGAEVVLRCAGMDPHWADAFADKGIVLTMLGRHEEALACYRGATTVDHSMPLLCKIKDARCSFSQVDRGVGRVRSHAANRS